MKKAIYRTLGLAILVAGCWYGYRYYRQMPERQDQIPTAKVQRGDVVIRAFSRGELRAARTVTLTAPNLFGTVQVTDLAPMGSLAKEKDLIVEYDDSERQSTLEENRLSVQSVDEQIKKAKADLAITQSQDAVTLLKTRYNVRRAELDVQSNPILAEIDAKKNLLNLEQQKRALSELESDIKSRQAQADSQLAVLQEQRNREMQRLYSKPRKPGEPFPQPSQPNYMPVTCYAMSSSPTEAYYVVNANPAAIRQLTATASRSKRIELRGIRLAPK